MRRPKYLRIGEVNEVNVTVSGLGTFGMLNPSRCDGGAPGFPLSPDTVLFTSLHLRGNLGYPAIAMCYEKYNFEGRSMVRVAAWQSHEAARWLPLRRLRLFSSKRDLTSRWKPDRSVRRAAVSRRACRGEQSWSTGGCRQERHNDPPLQIR